MPQEFRALTSRDRIDSFIVERVLGEGSFGITYLATDPSLRRKVAIKEFFPQKYAHRDPTGTIVPNDEGARNTFEWALERFSDEAQTLARFGHPNIVRVIAFVPELHHTAYIVMEYVEGVTLEDWVDSFRQRQAFPDKEDTLSVFRQLLDGCGAMHQAGILHRDIKPKNIMLRTTESAHGSEREHELVPVLIDFGSSRDLALQQHGFTALVTDGYSPPEQYSPNARQGQPADIYSLACTFFFCLTGVTPPIAGARLVEALPPVPQAQTELFGKRLVNAVLAGMNVKVEDRPPSIAAWRKSMGIDEVAGLSRGGGISRRMVIGAGVAAGVLALGGTATWLLRGRSPLSSFAHPLTVGWQKQLGRMYGDSFPQVRVSDKGEALVAANIVDDGGTTRMRALRIAPDGQRNDDWQDTQLAGMATAILPASDGGAYVGAGTNDGKAMLIRLDGNWHEQWRKEVGDGGVTAVLQSKDGLIMGIEGRDLSGAGIVAVDTGGSPSWRTAIDKGPAETIQRMIALKSGGFAVLGWGIESRDTPQGKLNQNYAFVALLDSEGNSRNRPQTKGLGAATAWAITEADDVIYVSGQTSDGHEGSQAHMFVWALDHAGTTQWLRWDYPNVPSGGRGLAAADGGVLYAGGWSGDQQKMRFAQIGPNGDIEWDLVAPAVGTLSAALDIVPASGGGCFAVGAAQISPDQFQLIVTRLDS